jgi:hypothetical protein
MRSAAPLFAAPNPSAARAGAVGAGTAVDVFERKGFWAHVRAGRASGWVKLNQLSLGSGGAGEIAALASGRTGSRNVVSASGGRGLDAQDFAQARPDPEAVAGLARFAVSEADAARFGAAGGLSTRRIDYVKAPTEGGR